LLAILGDDKQATNIQEALDFYTPYGLHAGGRLFLLHKDWLDHDGDSAMRSLETFLELPENSIGDWPASPKKSDWRTDICTSAYYEPIRQHVLKQYPRIIKMLEAQGHWIPPNLINGVGEI